MAVGEGLHQGHGSAEDEEHRIGAPLISKNKRAGREFLNLADGKGGRRLTCG